MTTVNELREKRATAWNAAKAFLESRRTDKGTLTAEDDATYTRMEQDITDLSREIARLERRDALDAELSRPVNTPITSKPSAAVGSSAADSAVKRGRASEPTSSRYQMFCRKVWMLTVVTLFRKNTTIDSLVYLRKKTSCELSVM